MSSIYNNLPVEIQENIDSFVWEAKKNDIKEDLLLNFCWFFYNNQYDEERYPHFRACDVEHNWVNTYDEDGKWVSCINGAPTRHTFTFYD
jgi:hypothetical protein